MPAPHTDEAEQLLAFVDTQREALVLAAHGLSDEQARLTPTASTLSVIGLLHHAAWTERGWVAMARHVDLDRPGYMEEFDPPADLSLADAIALLGLVGDETRAAVADLGLRGTFPNPKGVPWFPADVDEWDVRWMLLHLVEELARHAGHADIIRESIDGRTMGDISAEVAGWVMPEWE
jgi:hypothetical protein